MSEAKRTDERVDRLLAKAEEHLRHADEAYWDEEPNRVALHLAYAQAASTTAMALSNGRAER